MFHYGPFKNKLFKEIFYTKSILDKVYQKFTKMHFLTFFLLFSVVLSVGIDLSKLDRKTTDWMNTYGQ